MNAAKARERGNSEGTTGGGRLPENGLREIVVISGKGGTGKTTLAGSFAALAGRAVLADCDVDAANLGLILRPEVRTTHEFSGSRRAVIDVEKCTGCGRCADVCRGAAIREGDAHPEIMPFSCEGCGVCRHACPEGAIRMVDGVSGRWYVSDTPHGTLVHARLEPGEENSGKLVTVVRNEARRIAEASGRSLVLIDGPPGIGCPVIASLTGVSMALIVTEPTLSAMHDYRRVLEVCRHFGVPAAVTINRYDMHPANSRAITRDCDAEGVEVLGRIPYDPGVTSALLRGRTVVEDSDGVASRRIRKLWRNVLSLATLWRRPRVRARSADERTRRRRRERIR